MSTDRTPASGGTETVRNHPTDTAGSDAAEAARLDDAIRRADDLLVQSLRSEERSRKRRRLRWLAYSIGAIAMIAIAYNLALFIGILGQAAPTGAAAPTDSTALTVSQKEDRAAQLAQEGWQLWQQRQLTDAEEKFTEATRLDPQLTMAWNGLGWAQFNQGKYNEAEKSFKKTAELEPGHAAAENGLGQLYLMQRKYDQAEKHLLQSAKTPGATAAWSGLSRLYLLRGQWDKATEWSQKLVDSGDAEAQAMLDAAKAKKIPLALKQQITPPAPAAAKDASKGGDAAAGDASVQKGWQQLNRGQTTQAVATFNALLEQDPNDANALNGLGWALLRSPGKQADAKVAFEKAIKADPEAAGSINGLAICLKSEGKADEAMKLWQQMVDKYPGPNAGTYGLAMAYVERKDYPKALPLLEQLAKSDPSDQQVQQALKQARAAK